jgi:arsenate reductase (thioredoxin)
VNISDVAERSGLTTSAIRWYESIGAIPPAARGANGYRAYDGEDVARLRLVVSLRRIGLGPLEAGRLAHLCLERGAVDLDLAPIIAEQRVEIAQRRAELDRLDDELMDLELTIAAADRLRAAGRTATMTDAPIRVLFVCTGNSARSQLAEALLERIGGPDFAVESAGTEPKGVNPLTVRVLAESGIDWSAATSKSVETFVDQPFDYVITVCDRARQACPVFPGSYDALHWGLEDPAEVQGTDDERMAAFRRTYRELVQRIRPFVEVALRSAGRTRRATVPE